MGADFNLFTTVCNINSRPIQLDNLLEECNFLQNYAKLMKNAVYDKKH